MSGLGTSFHKGDGADDDDINWHTPGTLCVSLLRHVPAAHLTDEESEAQRGQAARPDSHRGLGLASAPADSEPRLASC